MAEKGNKYSVYQGLDSDPQINWGTVATTISKQLKSLRDLKVAERDAIDKATQDQMDQLNKLPDVNDRSLNRIVMEGSDNSKQYLLREAALVKRGLRKPKDYSLFLQSQKNGYSEFGNIVKNWDKWNTSKMEALEAGTQSALDAFTAEDIASFGNLKDKTIMTNPANGQIQVVSMGEDKNGNYTVMPNALKNPGAFGNPASINSRMNFDEKKRDTSALVNKEVEFIGKHITATRYKNGVVETIEDFTTAASYPKWKQASINKLTSNEYHMTQILTDQGYVLGRTLEEAQEKDPTVTEENFIQVDMSGDKPVPKLTEDQEKEAKKIVGDLIDSQINKEQKKTPGFKDSADDNKRKDEDTDDVGYIKELDIIMHGDPLEAEAALKRRIDTKNQDPNTPLDEKIVSFEITDDQIILRRAKGDPLTVDRVADTGVADDPKTAEDESIRTLSNLDDVVTINDLLSPKPLSRGRIEKLIEKQNLTLGKRREGGVGSKVGKSEIPAIANNAKAANGRTILESISAGGIGSRGTISMTDSNEKIEAVIGGIISEHMPVDLAKDLSNNKDLYGPTTIKQVPNMDQMEVTIGGKSVKFSTKRLTSLSEIANKITQVMNEAREEVNKNRTS